VSELTWSLRCDVIDRQRVLRAMSRADLPTDHETVLSGWEANVAGYHLQAIEELNQRITRKQIITSARPRVKIEPEAIDAGEAVQGSGSEFQIKLTNTGNAPLAYRIFPDCSCFLPMPPTDIPPGGSTIVRGRMDTSIGIGPVRHRLLISTNDVERPTKVVNFQVRVRPRYRTLSDAPDLLMVPKGFATFKVHLYASAGDPILVKSVSVSGLPGATATFNSWQGTLADPIMNEGPLQRSGTEITVKLDGAQFIGRKGLTITAETDDPHFRSITVRQTVQRGIATLPDAVYFGQLFGPATTTFVVSKPESDFKLAGFTSSNPHVKVTEVKAIKPGEYQVQVQYTGGAPKGWLTSILAGKTSDPDQPEIKVQVQGDVR